jgi:hypothetical protein
MRAIWGYNDDENYYWYFLLNEGQLVSHQIGLTESELNEAKVIYSNYKWLFDSDYLGKKISN